MTLTRSARPIIMATINTDAQRNGQPTKTRSYTVSNITIESLDELKSLSSGLNFDNRFSLYFIQCNETDHLAVFDLLKSKINKPSILLTVPIDIDYLINEWYSEQMKSIPDNAAVFLHGLDVLMEDYQKRYDILSCLNWNRNAFLRENRPLVILGCKETLRLLANYAPDFYDYYTMVAVVE